MIMSVEHIDAIARKRKRDVLYVTFSYAKAAEGMDDQTTSDRDRFDWKSLPIRKELVDWLDKQGIAWECCGEFANVDVMRSYHGQLYVDLPYDKSLPAFQALTAFLELPDGSMRFPEATFCYCPLDEAMKNAKHDEPGFWDRWAKSF